MNFAKQSQKQHERSVCDILVRTLNIDAKFEKYGNDINEPDCIYRLGRDSPGIEVADAWLTEDQAKKMWTVSRGEREFPKEGYEWLFDEPIYHVEVMNERIQNEINDKCSKNYSGADNIWLCIEERDPLSDEQSVKKYLQVIKIPEKHCFKAIYILHNAPTHEGGGYKIFDIYPNLKIKK